MNDRPVLHVQSAAPRPKVYLGDNSVESLCGRISEKLDEAAAHHKLMIAADTFERYERHRDAMRHCLFMAGHLQQRVAATLTSSEVWK